MSINLVHPSSKGYHDVKTTNSYVKGRPQVPQECIEFVKNNKLFNLNDNSKVLDLASGTGKFTELLAKSNFKDITAVEPSKEFRDSCSEILQKLKDTDKPDLSFQVLDGISTSIPAADESVDVLFVSQAFHWFSNTDSLKEFSRILKPNGTLIMIWYDMDLSSDVVNKYADVVHEKWYDGLAPQFRSYKWKKALEDFKPIFEQAGGKGLIDPNLQMEKFHFNQKANKQVCIERALSISYISHLKQETKDQIIKEVSEVLDNHPDSSDNKTFDFPYRVELYYTQKK
ncbi:hypothetical protein DICPUDRAFT_87399 [Dictyostelium purpureum]|uniref:Methyltransferase type 11 domain-containing protein n=1 Tax=Dictyostelium purpureum TaxID=5786 RepID=F0ZHV0_DICPU|nr:uncharacterized protein DICPUDRAFT_87399 [Dictyostelium purpureum]EGC36474.1 hypothetical protein DICPUDRAFT_87399 [Dictyostelium purpureum]|eukprot:XP_003286987.1 hypothetical protein DICPUDRAFT_87399 [Dictyostelium purpureum]